MKRIRLGVCIGDREYADRFTACLANRYHEQLELHIFTEHEKMYSQYTLLDVLLLGDCDVGQIPAELECPVLCLFDSETETPVQEKGDVYWVDKYQEVNKIVDEIMQHVGEEIRNVQQNGCLPAKAQILAVYSLSENAYQLPLSVTLASILSEQQRVLLLDLQENSGLSQFVEAESGTGLEEMLVMAESGKFSSSRMISCIGHLDRADYVYPVDNTECLCEVSASTYLRMIRMTTQEMGYNTVILNLGSRFAGFFELLGECGKIYLLKSRGGLGQWRQQEFLAELDKHGMSQISERIQEMEIPLTVGPVLSCERLVEQWKWNEFGDSIRSMMPGVMQCG